MSTSKKGQHELVFKTVCGLYIHLSEITVLSSARFRDEDGVVDALAITDSTPRSPMWLKAFDNIYMLDLDNHFNHRAAGLDPEEGRHYSSPIHEELEHILIDEWAKLNYESDIQ